MTGDRGRPPPKVTALQRWAARHPLLVVIASFVVMLALRLVLFDSGREALIAAVVIAVIQAILWLPPFAPVRRYTLRLLEDEGRGPSAPKNP